MAKTSLPYLPPPYKKKPLRFDLPDMDQPPTKLMRDLIKLLVIERQREEHYHSYAQRLQSQNQK
jgi:hypothetical protein